MIYAARKNNYFNRAYSSGFVVSLRRKRKRKAHLSKFSTSEHTSYYVYQQKLTVALRSLASELVLKL